MEFKQLESFVTVVKHQSFTKAARQLFISQPTISSHIQALEEELKSQLIIRTTKSIEITQRGQELYECASNILSQRDHLMKSWAAETEQIIQLGVSSIPSAYILPEILPEFGKHFPEVYFNIHQSDSQGIIDAMNNGEYDVGMIGMPYNNRHLFTLPFYKDEMVLITPVTDYFLELQKVSDFQVTPKLLRKHPVILRENGSGTLKKADHILEHLQIQPEELNIIARINDQESIKNLTASGLGISFISERAAQNFVAEKRLLAFQLPKPIATRSLYLVMHKNLITKSYVDNFIQFVQKYF